MSKCIIVRGAPGSGKTTFASKKFPGVFHVENDMFLIKNGEYRWSKERVREAIAWCMDMAAAAMQAGLDVVICNTFTKRKYIASYKDLADRCKADFKVYRCTGSFKNVHGLDDGRVQSFRDAMEDWDGEELVIPGEAI